MLYSIWFSWKDPYSQFWWCSIPCSTCLTQTLLVLWQAAFTIATECFISVHYTTVHQELECAGISLKKLHWIAKEWNENLHAHFIRYMAQYAPDQLGFLDETSKDEWTAIWKQGHAKKGQWAEMKGLFVWGRRRASHHRWHGGRSGSGRISDKREVSWISRTHGG